MEQQHQPAENQRHAAKGGDVDYDAGTGRCDQIQAAAEQKDADQEQDAAPLQPGVLRMPVQSQGNPTHCQGVPEMVLDRGLPQRLTVPIQHIAQNVRTRRPEQNGQQSAQGKRAREKLVQGHSHNRLSQEKT